MKTKTNSKFTTKDIALMGLFVALIIAGGFIKIPTPIVPVTLQVEISILAGLVLGGLKGGLCILIYLVMGIIGIPVFTAGGGPQYVLYPTFGYIIGFVCCAFFVGYMSEFLNNHNKLNSKWKYLWVFLVCFGGLLIVYALGVVYMYLLYNLYKGIEMTIAKALYSGFVLFLPFDTLGCVVATLVYVKLLPYIRMKINNKNKEKIKIEEGVVEEENDQLDNKNNDAA